MSCAVIEPKALSSAPIFSRTTTVLLLISSASACAASRSLASRFEAAFFNLLASASTPFRATTASFRGRRKFLPYPSVTSFTSPAWPTFSTSLVSMTRNSLALRYRLIGAATSNPRPNPLHHPSSPMPRRSDRVAEVAIKNALSRRQRCFVFLSDLDGTGRDECLDSQDPQREHVQLSEHRDPGREVDGADDQPEGAQKDGLWRRWHPRVTQ